MDFVIREMKDRDKLVWAEMRAQLWPDEASQAHAEAIDKVLQDKDVWGFIAETSYAAPAGFAEVALRKYANGCESQPVPFLEGIWVNPQFRRQGVGRRLLKHLEAFLAARGFHEIGSDTQIDNRISQAAHLGWGFSETERVVYFRKIWNIAHR
ncbi:MAG: GNAT family N-acetyltransferase [Alphaproteobacteria bacterium]|nr:GNAT family N-acetyltransferase [Alphaproteobacteria bacterium]